MNITLTPDDPRIGKIIGEDVHWPAVDIRNQSYTRAEMSTYGLKAPAGEHWFVMIPGRFDDGELNITIESEKKSKATKAE